jgi:hypothetical protein
MGSDVSSFRGTASTCRPARIRRIEFAEFPPNVFHCEPPIGSFFVFSTTWHRGYLPMVPLHIANDGTESVLPDERE